MRSIEKFGLFAFTAALGLSTTPDAYAAVTTNLTLAGTQLNVIGDAGNNAVSVVVDDDTNTIQVLQGMLVLTNQSSSVIKKVKIDLKGGEDFLTIRPKSSTTEIKYAKAFDVDLGSGADDAMIDFRKQGGQGIVWMKSKVQIVVRGGEGADEVYANFSRKHGGSLSFAADMGPGNDTCFANQWADISGGASVKFDVKGGLGQDTVGTWSTYDSLSGYTSIDVSGDSSFSVAIDGGVDADTVSALYAGVVDGKVNLTAAGGAGGDDIDVDVLGAATSNGLLTAKAQGLAGDDAIALDATNSAGAGLQIDASIDGGLAIDACSETGPVTMVNCE